MKNKIMIKKIIIDKDGGRYLPIEKAGIPPLYILTDNVAKTQFPGEKQIYISIKEIIKWFKKELKYLNGEKKEIAKQNIKFLEGLLTKKVEKIENDRN